MWWVYKIKFNSSGQVDRFKTNLLAKEIFKQREWIIMINTFSPIMKTASIKVLLAWATT